MSADLLRRAAAKIRETAQAATPGPYRTVDVFPHGVALGLPYGDVHGAFAPGTADHLALWSPDVAELVASLLDGAVVRHAHLTTDDIEMRAYGLAPEEAERALHAEFALARRILGESA